MHSKHITASFDPIAESKLRSSHSIPHNRHIRQAELSTYSIPQVKYRDFHTFRLQNRPKNNPIQAAARHLYGIGLNVFPQPLGKKGGYPWKKLQYLRLHPTAMKCSG